MSVHFINDDKKPDQWPANAIECQLENIQMQLEKFKKHPNFINKEILLSLISHHDLNQRSMTGLLRTTEYEVMMLNWIFIEATIINLYSLKTFIYEIVGEKTRMQKMASWFPEGIFTNEIKEFEGLMPQLKLYHIVYQSFNIDKDKTFAYKLIDFVQETLDYSLNHLSKKEHLNNVDFITNTYITLLNDLSYFRCLKRTSIWAFTREEISDLFKLAAILIKENGDNPLERPLKGVLMTCISNYILKSRNEYNSDYICKYIRPEIVKMSLNNREIWMSTIENLNDEREQRIIPELFMEDDWKTFGWSNSVDFTQNRNYYVSSFCKSLDDDRMKEKYGQCVYGYKDDRLAEILSPIYYRKTKRGKKIPVFSQVITFDVLYDRNEAKGEINFLCSVLDSFDITEKSKTMFLEEILQYWILSVKDEKWSPERERRYVLFMYDDYKYIEVNVKDPRFLKLKTSMFMYPDFIFGDNPLKNRIKVMVDNKREVTSTKPYLFCLDCFNRDFDIVASGLKKDTSCPLCNSKEIIYETPNH